MELLNAEEYEASIERLRKQEQLLEAAEHRLEGARNPITRFVLKMTVRRRGAQAYEAGEVVDSIVEARQFLWAAETQNNLTDPST